MTTYSLCDELEHREKTKKFFLKLQKKREQQEIEDRKLFNTFFAIYYKMSKEKRKEVREIINDKSLKRF